MEIRFDNWLHFGSYPIKQTQPKLIGCLKVQKYYNLSFVLCLMLRFTKWKYHLSNKSIFITSYLLGSSCISSIYNVLGLFWIEFRGNCTSYNIFPHCQGFNQLLFVVCLSTQFYLKNFFPTFDSLKNSYIINELQARFIIEMKWKIKYEKIDEWNPCFITQLYIFIRFLYFVIFIISIHIYFRIYELSHSLKTALEFWQEA